MNKNMHSFASIETILYVESQEISTQFYKKILRMKPVLEVPGMSEFLLADNFKLGLMPNTGIARILGENCPHPSTGLGIPRCELYLHCINIESEYENALQNGAKIISGIEARNWGDKVFYISDPDGHIIAFATKI